jgi:serine/threonine-protein kinase HipA
MEMTVASLDLFLLNQYVGTVAPDRRDRTKVTLDVSADFNERIVLSESFTTISGRSAPTEAVSNFLGGYVPEGSQRIHMSAKRHIESDNLFDLLHEFGGSIAGAVTLRDHDEPPNFHMTYEPLSDEALSELLLRALDESDQGITDDSRSTLPGWQPKVLVARFGDEWLRPHGRAHSTHILKPQIPDRAERIFDEHYSHLLGRHMGLLHYSSDILVACGVTFLAIERFDREVINDTVQLIHQEDLAQVMSLDWRDTNVKFQEPSRPSDPARASVRNIASALSLIPGGDRAVEQWLRQLTYRVAIGDNDGHAKNVAVMHTPGATTLTDVYDAVPNLFQQERIAWNLGLAIDGIFDQRLLSTSNLVNEAVSWGTLSSSRAFEILKETLTDLQSALDIVPVPIGASEGLQKRLLTSVGRLVQGDEIGDPSLALPRN